MTRSLNLPPAVNIARGRRALVVAVMVLLNLTDGYDVLSMSFAAPAAAVQFKLGSAALGMLLSAAFIGMAIGAFALSPVADRIGRRPTLLLCLVLMTVGMIAAAASGSLFALLLARICTGLGVGAMLPTLNAVVAEFTGDRRRGLAIGVVQTGYPLGGVLAGLVASALMIRYGWRVPFAIGAAFGSVSLLLVFLFVAESPRWLDVDRAARAASRSSWRDLPGVTTASLAMTFLFVQMANFGIISWLPKLLMQQGMAMAEAVHLLTLWTVGSVVGGIGAGLFLRPSRVRRATIAAIAIAAFCLVAIAATGDASIVLHGLVPVTGAAVGAAMIGLYLLLAESYAVELRVTASGLIVGASRIGAILGPLLCGLVLARGGSPSYAIAAFAFEIAVGALALAGIRGPSRPQR